MTAYSTRQLKMKVTHTNYKKILTQQQNGKMTGLCNSILHITTKKNPIHHKYVLHQHTLQTESSTKYLGVTVQSDLKWNKHIDNISPTAIKHLNFIKRNLEVNSKSVKEKAYTSLIRPKLEYSSCVWDPHTKSKNDQ